MLRSVVYDTYYPYLKNGTPQEDEDINLFAPNGNGYKGNNNGQGIEYNFIASDEDVIDYTNYYRVSFDSFWDTLNTRYNLYKTYINNGIELFLTKENFQQKLLEIYQERLDSGEKNINPYYCYIKINDDSFYEKFISLTDVNKKNLFKFLVDQNKYIKETSGAGSTINYTVQTLTGGDEDPEVYKNSYKNADFYIGVNSFNDPITGIKTNLFYYYEFQIIKQKIQHKITKLQVNAPIGTTFFLNRELNPIVVTRYKNYNTLDKFQGEYILEPEDFVTLKYITFPRDTIPKLKQLNEHNVLENVDLKQLCLTVSYIYDDEYDVAYIEE